MPSLTSGRGSRREPGHLLTRRVRDQSGREEAGGEWQEPGGVSELLREWPERGSAEGQAATESWRDHPGDPGDPEPDMRRPRKTQRDPAQKSGDLERK